MYVLLVNMLRYIECEIFERCELSSYNGYVLTKYYRKSCPHCQRLAPHIEEIDNRLERHGIEFNVHSVECGDCDCSVNAIDAVPTVILSKDNKELGKFKGYREYEFIVDFLCKHMGINKKILNTRVKNITGKVVKLKQNDFFSAFEGPWIILFYKKEDEIKRELIKEIADVYAEKVMVGEIHENESKKIEHMYNIAKYPTVIGLYKGLSVYYPGKDNLPDLIDFTDRLINPSFIEIDLEKFNELKKDLKRGDSIFIVFYTNIHQANAYFKDISHELKYKATIYKSADKELFDFANIHPAIDGDVGDDNTVTLACYRNEVFYKYPYALSKPEELYNWIFYAHYPHVSKINNNNFQSLFHGFKPLVILLTREESMVDKFEMLSVERHMGVPFANEIFTVFDMNEFSAFGNMFFGKYNVPGLIIYNPYTKQLFGENRIITDDNFYMEAHRMLRNYDLGKLKEYSSVKGYKIKYLLSMAFVFAVLFIGFGCFNSKKVKYVKDE